MENARRLFPTLTYVDSMDEALADADLTVLATEWPQFRQMDPERIGQQVARRMIIDGRNVLDPSAWRAADWTFRGMGRP